MEKSTATREGEPAEGDQLVEGYTIQKVAAMTSTGACGFRKSGRFGKGGIGARAMDVVVLFYNLLTFPPPRSKDFPGRDVHTPSAATTWWMDI